MPFTRPTLTELVNRIESDIETRVTGGETLLRRSILKILARVFAGAVHLLYSYLGYQSEQLFVSTADEDNIEKHGDEYGLPKIGAVQATGIIVATGTNGTVIDAGTELQTTTGVKYTTDSSATIAAGTANLAITAVEGGDDGNQDSGTILIFVSPITGINSQTTVDSSGLTGGTDEETTEEWRDRILLRKQYPPYGGCESDFEQWMLEYPGVTRAWVFPSYNGIGTVGCTFVMDDSTPYIPTSATIALVKAYLVEHEDPATGRTVGIPVTAGPGLFMITLTEQDVDFSLEIYPNTTAVQNAIDAELTNLILTKGGAGETIYLSDINSALANITTLDRYTLVAPIVNIATESNKIHALGTITYSDF
jgi:uncharacterized phage protein gp47/JayE